MVKLVDRHAPADFMPPPLGNLVVLLNPASEAAKWTKVQEAVWRRIEMSGGDMARASDYKAGHEFFRDEQRPIVVSATAARDWPPGGVWASDCPDLVRLARKVTKPPPNANLADLDADRDLLDEFDQAAERRAQYIDYDWATYDLFPAFRFDFRPAASSLGACRTAAPCRNKSGRGHEPQRRVGRLSASARFLCDGRPVWLLGLARAFRRRRGERVSVHERRRRSDPHHRSTRSAASGGSHH